MTLTEYIEKISKQISACTSENEALHIIKTAEKVLRESNISESSKKRFWTELYESLGGDWNLCVESQDSSALAAIIIAAKAAIAANAKKQ